MSRPRIPCDEPVDRDVLAERLQFKCGKLTNNRIYKAPMSEQIYTWHDTVLSRRGLPTQRVLNVYEKWGLGGYGIIVTGNIVVDPVHLEVAGNGIICKENDSPSLRHELKKLALLMQADGALAIMQINHAGRTSPISLVQSPFAPSLIQLPGHGVPIPLTEEQVQTEVIDRYAYAAKVAHKTGFDGVEVILNPSFIIGQFLSSESNQRTDKYGGSLENRNRVLLDIHNKIREDIGEEGHKFAVGLKIMSKLFQGNDLTIKDAVYVAETVGKVGFDYVNLSGGTLEKTMANTTRESTKEREDFFTDFTNQVVPVLRESSVIVFVTGGFRTVAGMANAVKQGYTDGVGIARPTTAEPDIAKKMLNGEASSTLASQFDDYDFPLAKHASRTQIYQMGEQSLVESDGNLFADLADFTSPEEADQFKKELAVYKEYMKMTVAAGKNLPQVFPYKKANILSALEK